MFLRMLAMHRLLVLLLRIMLLLLLLPILLYILPQLYTFLMPLRHQVGRNLRCSVPRCFRRHSGQ